ncbi:MAG: nitrile hydratase subunit beta [Rhodospirillales bacterium]|nr:nitrile hydratase subunit beta [Rhodospirillales bacterium]
MMRRVHDIGGLSVGEIDPSDHAVEPWQKRINATFTTMILDPSYPIRLDELRRAMEELGAERYDRLEYFERQTQGFVDLLIEKGILGQTEIQDRMAEIKGRTNV